MASDVCWNNLPSVVLLEIFKRISHAERISASSTCKEWRKALFFPNFWRELNVKIFSKDDQNAVEGCQFLTRSFIPSTRNVKIIFSYQKQHLSQLVNLLSKLSVNRQVHTLYLYSFGKPIWNPCLSSCITHLIALLQNVKSLNTLHLNHCWLSLLQDDHFKQLLEGHKKSLTCLGLGAVFSDSACSPIIQIPVDIGSFSKLAILSLDHSWITDDIINQLSGQTMLKRLVVQLDEILKVNQIELESWIHFHESLPECELRVNLVQGVSADVLQVLTTGMPVTHIKLLYCTQLDLEDMSIFSSFQNLKSVWCLSGQDSHTPIAPIQNPLVICAWACKRLEELVIAGFHLDCEDVIGIGRLGSKLKRLDVCSDDLVTLYETDQGWESSKLTSSQMIAFVNSMTKELNRPWSPINKAVFKKSNLSVTDNKISNIVEILSEDLHF